MGLVPADPRASRANAREPRGAGGPRACRTYGPRSRSEGSRVAEEGRADNRGCDEKISVRARAHQSESKERARPTGAGPASNSPPNLEFRFLGSTVYNAAYFIPGQNVDPEQSKLLSSVCRVSILCFLDSVFSLQSTRSLSFAIH